MPRQSRTYPLEIHHDHTIARIGSAAALIDTGSPLTFRAPEMISSQLGEPIRWLVGTDVLRRHRVLLDWVGRRVVLDAPDPIGEEIPLVPHAGVYQVEVSGQHGSALAFLDTGAHLSYAPESAVRGMRPVCRHRDFYPLIGEFEVPVYELTVRVGSRRIRGKFGVLPELMAQLLGIVGATGWILGSDFFRGRAIQLDLGRNRLIDAAPHRERTTRPATTTRRSEGIRKVSSGIEGWRGWRFVDVNGSPLLQSLTAPDVWSGPVFTSDQLPTSDARNSQTGIHAYRTPLNMHALRSSAAIVYGQVTLYGQVCVHELGYRGERARIDRLFLRACGHHPWPRDWARPSLFDLVNEMAAPSRSYCGCNALQADEWLAYEQLQDLAVRLGETYQCDVEIDPERARTSACRNARSQVTAYRARQ